VVDDDHPVHLALRIEVGQPVCDRLGVCVPGVIGETRERSGQLESPEAKRADSAPPDPDPADPLTPAAEPALQPQRTPKDLRVERTREAAVSGEGNDRDGPLLVVLLEERQPAYRRARARG